MSIYRDGYGRNLKVHLENNPKIKGLREFRNRLSRDFFADVQVRNRFTNNDQANLIIELNCNYELKEIIRFLKNNEWCNNDMKHCCGIDLSNLGSAIKELRKINRLEIDVEEFSIFLKDTSIIVKKIFKESIQQQMCELFLSIAEHYRHITKNFTETPYELYIPVFEEDILENDIKIARIEQAHNDKKDYFGYWGLYFDSEEDAVIYDLPRKRIITGELHMLNH